MILGYPYFWKPPFSNSSIQFQEAKGCDFLWVNFTKSVWFLGEWGQHRIPRITFVENEVRFQLHFNRLEKARALVWTPLKTSWVLPCDQFDLDDSSRLVYFQRQIRPTGWADLPILMDIHRLRSCGGYSYSWMGEGWSFLWVFLKNGCFSS